jgi:hypothetical protein
MFENKKTEVLIHRPEKEESWQIKCAEKEECACVWLAKEKKDMS